MMIFWNWWNKRRAAESRLNTLEEENIHLTQRVRDVETEKLILEDRMRSVLEDRSHLWSLVEQSLQQERMAYHMHINREWQKIGMAAPYPEAPHIPPGEVPKRPENPIIPRSRLASEVQSSYTKKFIDNYINGMDKELTEP